jgi:hypothetical protein
MMSAGKRWGAWLGRSAIVIAQVPDLIQNNLIRTYARQALSLRHEL